MNKDLYSAPWTPEELARVKDDKKKTQTKPDSTISSEEGEETLDGEGIPMAGYSAYGLKITDKKE